MAVGNTEGGEEVLEKEGQEDEQESNSSWWGKQQMTSALPKVSRYARVVKGGSTLLKRTQKQGEKGKHLITHLVLQMI